MSISQTFHKQLFIFALLISSIFVAVTIIKAQISNVDPSFNPVISKNVSGGNFTLQPDGKILVYGNFQVINGTVKKGIARFNADGTLDNSFNFTQSDFYIGSVVVQPNQKLIVGGYVRSSMTNTSVAKVLRLNTDGSMDNSFSSSFGDPIPTGSTGATVQAIQPDGKILISIDGYYSGYHSLEIRRLNSDGTFDTSFTIIDFGFYRFTFISISKIVVLANGKILVASNASGNGSSNGSLQRYNSDGTRDTNFESPSLTGTAGGFFNGTLVNDFEVLTDGSVIIVGDFNTVNAVSRVNIAKLLPAGNVDLNFAPINVFQNREPAAEVGVFSSGKILIRTGFVTTGTGTPGTTNRFISYNTDGSAGNSFVSPTNLLSVSQFVIDNADNVLLYGSFTENGETISKFARLALNGNLISSFTVTYGVGGAVSALAIQTNGKVIIAGDFTNVGGVSRNNIARLNADGSLDQSFTSSAGFNGTVEALVVQSDNKILVGGGFTSYNGTARTRLARLNSDGSLDASFNPSIDSIIYSTSLQSDGKILIGGQFTSVNGQTRNGVARLNTDGSLDAAFNPQFALPTMIRRVLVQPDGKIIAGGTFSGVNGFNRTGLVRLNTDGTLDATFNAGNIGSVSLVELQPDGKYLVYTNSLFRLNADGTIDQTFKAADISGSINAILVQTDGSVIVGGNFIALGNNLRSNLARLRSDGSVDKSFFPVSANNTVRAIARQSDGRVLIGGDFTTVADETRLGAARLIVGQIGGRQTPFDFDGDGRADVAVFRPSRGIWYLLKSLDNSFSATQFGLAGDLIAPADYDGDGRTDIAVYRGVVPGAGGKAYFYILYSSDNSFHPIQFGNQGDVPVSGDWDGDGKNDLAVYRNASAAGGQSYFFYRPSSIPGSDFRSLPWGTAGDKPLVGDFDGDGKNDAAVFRPSNGNWFILKSSNNQVIDQQFGLSTDIPTPADYDGDGKTNIAVFRPSNGYWYTSLDPSIGYGGVQFGAAGDLPVAADYDGDGRADIAVYRPNGGVWYLLRSSSGFTGIQFGISEDKPIPNAYFR